MTFRSTDDVTLVLHRGVSQKKAFFPSGSLVSLIIRTHHTHKHQQDQEVDGTTLEEGAATFE
jgi:hypothetical protein